LNAHRDKLPGDVGKYLREQTVAFDRLVPIRNRIAHSRPLNFDDLAVALDTCQDFVRSNSDLWSELRETLIRLKEEPSFVLGLEIPAYEAEESQEKHNLPTPDFDETGFLGRKQQISELLKLIQGAFPIISITGAGGLGKTALALTVAYDILDLPIPQCDAIVWTSSRTQVLTPHQVKRIENAIKDSLGMLESVSQQLSGTKVEDPVEEVLEYLSEFRILLILDNLETVMDERLTGFLKRLPRPSKVLITSRIGLGAYDRPIKLEPLEEGESVQYLRALATVRGVPELGKMPTKDLAIFCRRMKNNPGYIKWFVSAVQAGKRPEEVLANRGVFLDFCMSNVYDYLNRESRTIIDMMIALPGRHSQAELNFLSGFDDIVAFQRAIQQLLTTSMIVMRSQATGSTFETHYEITELARAYLGKHHPVDSEEYKRLTKRKSQLVAAGEHLQSEQSSDPYSIYNIKMRSHSDRIICAYLYQALVKTKYESYDEAEELTGKASKLAPGFFEVHRVSAWVCARRGNISAAHAEYESAIELEPRRAPLRFWYGQFLMRYMDDLPASLAQLKEAETLDPNAYQIALEVARVHLYMKEFDKSKAVLDITVKRPNISTWGLRKLYDLYIQYYQRHADTILAHLDPVGALTELGKMRSLFESLKLSMVDLKMRERLKRSLPAIRSCIRFATNEAGHDQGMELEAWILRESQSPMERWSGDYARQDSQVYDPGDASAFGERHDGNVDTIQKTYGFVRARDGRRHFFHRSSFARPDDWSAIRVGSRVSFVEGESNGRPCALDLLLEVGDSEDDSSSTG